MSDTGQRTLAAIVFTDAVQYSARVGSDEEATVAMVRADLDLMRSLCSQFEGRVLKSMGDGLMMLFSSAVNAVSCSLEIQKAIAERAKATPDQEPLLHRIGVHLGDVLLTQDDAHGEGVNVAARLQERSEPGGICLSQTVYDVVKGRLFLEAVPLGELQLKHVLEPVAAYRVAGVAPARKQQKSVPIWAWGTAAVVALVAISSGTAFLVSRNSVKTEPVASKSTSDEIDKKIAELTRLAQEIDRKNAAAKKQAEASPKAPAAKPTTTASGVPAKKVAPVAQRSQSPPQTIADSSKTPSDAVKPPPTPDVDIPGPDDVELAELSTLLSKSMPKYEFDPVVDFLKNHPEDPDKKLTHEKYVKLDDLMKWVRQSVSSSSTERPIPVSSFGRGASVIGGDEDSITVKMGEVTETRNYEDLTPGQMLFLMQALLPRQAKLKDKLKMLDLIRVFAEEYDMSKNTMVRVGRPPRKGPGQLP